MNEYLDLVKKVDKHDADLYSGSGRDNPSITTRLTLLEMSCERGQKMTNERFEKFDSLLTKAAIVSFTTCFAVIGFLIKTIFFPGH